MLLSDEQIEALKLVLELATYNSLSIEDCGCDLDLQDEMNRQDKALEVVRRLIAPEKQEFKPETRIALLVNPDDTEDCVVQAIAYCENDNGETTVKDVLDHIYGDYTNYGYNREAAQRLCQEDLDNAWDHGYFEIVD